MFKARYVCQVQETSGYIDRLLHTWPIIQLLFQRKLFIGTSCLGIQIYCIWDYYLIEIKRSEIPHYLSVSLLVYICRSYAQRFQVYHPPPLRSACKYMWGWNVFILSKRGYRSGYRPGKHVQEMHQEGRDYY